MLEKSSLRYGEDDALRSVLSSLDLILGILLVEFNISSQTYNFCGKTFSPLSVSHSFSWKFTSILIASSLFRCSDMRLCRVGSENYLSQSDNNVLAVN